MAHTRIATFGLPIAASGIAHSIPLVTPAPDAAWQPDVTPPQFRSSIVTMTP
jgi:hypothetical protein